MEAALLAPSPLRVVAALTAAAALALTARGGRRAAPVQIRLDAEGRLHLRATDGSEGPAQVVYCGRRLVALEGPAGRLAVWPDALPASAWRRLVVACRWPQPPAPATRAGEQAN